MSAPTFGQALEQAEVLARQSLPQELHERLSAAVSLVRKGHCLQRDDGTWTVQSGTDAAQIYTHVNGECPCDDAHYNHPPRGLCKHRLSVFLARKVLALMRAAPAGTQEPAPEGVGVNPKVFRSGTKNSPLYEAPVSITLKATFDGQEVLVTLRGHDFASVQVQVEEASAWLKAHGSAPQAAPTQGQAGWCQQHQVQMKQTTKEGQSWWSHKTPEGQWCKGR
jgi:hypothetical protein